MRFLIPEGGVSALDAPGQPFHDPEADEALFATIESDVRADRPRAADRRLPQHINDPKPSPTRCVARVPRDRRREPTVTTQPMPRIARRRSSSASAPRSRAGVPIIGGGAGTGLSAKCEEAGGIDLIVIYNSGRYRMAGRGSLAGLLAYGNANEIVVRDGARGAAGGQAHAGARRRQRHRPVHDRRPASCAS